MESELPGYKATMAPTVLHLHLFTEYEAYVTHTLWAPFKECMSCYMQMLRAVSDTEDTQEHMAQRSVPVLIAIVSMATSKGSTVRILQRRLEHTLRTLEDPLEKRDGNSGWEKKGTNTMNTQP